MSLFQQPNANFFFRITQIGRWLSQLLAAVAGRRTWRIYAASAIAAGFILPSSIRASTLYAIGANYELFTLNPATGAASLVGSAGPGVNYSDSGLAFLGNNLYVTNFVISGSFDFGTLNTTTGAFTLLSNQAGSPNWFGLAANHAAGVMYTDDLNDNDTLKQVSPSGIGTPIGTGMGIETDGLAYDDTDKILYGATQTGGIYKINTLTGTATEIGTTGLPNAFFASLAFNDQTDVLYMLNENGSSGAESLYTINVSTGNATLIGSDGSHGLEAIAFSVPAPEPSTWILAAIGVAGLCFVRRTRQKRVKTDWHLVNL